MKKSCVVLLAAAASACLVFVGCAPQAGYTFKMATSSTISSPPPTMAYSDDKVDITFNISEDMYKGVEGFSQYDQYSGISFVLTNKTDKAVTIDWNKVAFKDYRGASGNVIMHNNIKYNECSNLKPITIVPAKGKIEEIVIPCYGVTFMPGQYARWNLSFLPSPRVVPNVSFGVYMPLQFETLTKEYEFNFIGSAGKI